MNTPSATSITSSWRWLLVRNLYRIASPFLLLIALPSWLLKMARRGGWATPLAERFGFYRIDEEWEPFGVMHFHAVSVGETILALKLIRAIQKDRPDFCCALAVSTATAYLVARESGSIGIRIVYAPVDLPWIVRRYMQRFSPSKIILIEAEAWPELLDQCQQKKIPVVLVNARLSPRSERRYLAMRAWIAPLFQKIEWVAVQENSDVARFASLGIEKERIHLTGSIKFDPSADRMPILRDEFSALLTPLAGSRKVILAASTHAGEEVLLAKAVHAAGGFFLCVPRHAERRAEVKEALENVGFQVILKTQYLHSLPTENCCLVIDTTGELKDWTAHCDAVIIGKSFLALGGQNPCEAIMAKKPLIFGLHMENFEPLCSSLVAANGALRIEQLDDLTKEITTLLAESERMKSMPIHAEEVLMSHANSTVRTIELLDVN
jgi:3-deoxy-D-manno-octulosonic-acid transferase